MVLGGVGGVGGGSTSGGRGVGGRRLPLRQQLHQHPQRVVHQLRLSVRDLFDQKLDEAQNHVLFPILKRKDETVKWVDQ